MGGAKRLSRVLKNQYEGHRSAPSFICRSHAARNYLSPGRNLVFSIVARYTPVVAGDFFLTLARSLLLHLLPGTALPVIPAISYNRMCPAVCYYTRGSQLLGLHLSGDDCCNIWRRYNLQRQQHLRHNKHAEEEKSPCRCLDQFSRFLRHHYLYRLRSLSLGSGTALFPTDRSRLCRIKRPTHSRKDITLFLVTRRVLSS